MPVGLPKLALLFAAAFAAGAINAVSGGGTLLTFPTLLSTGMGPVTANGTSTVALVPGAFSAFFSYRAKAQFPRTLLAVFLIPSVVGGFVGALLASGTSDVLFSNLVPWLILGATFLFMLQDPVRRWVTRRTPAAPSEAPVTPDDRLDRDRPLAPARLALIAGAQLVVAVYGGFFGAGMGIMMLAVVGLMGFSDIHQMNGLKNLAGACINVVASVTFFAVGKVSPWLALLMAVGATLGGYAGAGLAQRAGQRAVRGFVTLTGLVMGGYFLFRHR